MGSHAKRMSERLNLAIGIWIDFLAMLLLGKRNSYKWIPFPKGIFLFYDINYFRRGDIQVIFDVGANIGQSSIAYRKVWPDALIHAFEPVHSTYNKLTDNILGKGISCHNFGFGSISGEYLISINEYDQVNSLKNAKEAAHSEVCRLETVDGFIKNNNINRIDLLKLDVEGFEIEALKGAQKALSAKLIEFIYVEVGVVRSDETKTHFCDIDYFLSSMGYSLSGIYDSRRFGLRKEFVEYTNFLYKIRD